MSSVPIVILAGGKNSRFFPLNYHGHKGLLELVGRSLIDRQLENLAQYGFKEVFFVHNPKTAPDELKKISQTAKSLGLTITFQLQKEANGMGDALLQVKDNLPEKFAVSSAYHVESGTIFKQLLELPGPLGLVVVKTDHPEDYGVLKLHDDKVVGIVEKPKKEDAPSKLRVQSLYLLTKSYLTILAQTKADQYSFEVALDKAIQDMSASYIVLEKPLISLKYPWRIFPLFNELAQDLPSTTHPSAKIAKTAVIDDSQGPVIISQDAKIGHATKLVGPCFIGQNTTVGDFSLIRQSSLEANVSIGVHADIARSIFLSHSSFHGFGFVGDSIVGCYTKIGAGLITANKRLDRQHIKVWVKDRSLDIGQNNHGTIIGEHASIGIRVSTMPGVYIGANATITPNTTIKRHIPHHEIE